MWGLLSNISSLMTIITFLISIPGGILTTVRFLKHTSHPPLQQATKSNTNSQINKPSFKTSILEDLDIWDKAEVIGYGIFYGICNGFIALGITFLILFFLSFGILLSLILTHLTIVNKLTIINLFWTIATITFITGLIVGVLVGVVSGVNETKNAVELKWLFINRRRSSSNKTQFPQNKLAPELPKAPSLKITNNQIADQVYYSFGRQIERQNNPFMGELIIYAKDNQCDEVVNLLDKYNWEQYPSDRTNSLFAKQACIKLHRTNNNNHVYAAVYQNLLADKSYVIWSDTKQPAYAVVSPGEATLIDWLK